MTNFPISILVILAKFIGIIALLFISATLIWILVKLRSLRKGGYFRNYPYYFCKKVRASSCFDQLPKHFIVLLLLHEDIAFFSHHGFNFREVYNSLKRMLVTRQLKGGSSLSQQTVKLLLFFNSPRLVRKFYEVMAVLILEYLYSKEEILSIYLQTVRFGPHVFGLGEACGIFFSKSPFDLTMVESEVLVSMLTNPSKFLASINVEPLKIYQQKPVDYKYDFTLSYEKILHFLRLKQVIAARPVEVFAEVLHGLALDAGHPAGEKDEENKLIAEVAHYLHDIPRAIQQIGECELRMPRILDAALTAEERLLVGYYLQSPYVNTVLLKQQGHAIDIESVRSLARYHRIAQLAEFENTPNNTLDFQIEDSKALQFDGTAHFLRKRKALEILIHKFNEHQLPFYLVRGFDLASRYYNKPFQKLFVDFDIAIERTQFAQLNKILREMNFMIKASDKKLSPLNGDLVQNFSRLDEGMDCYSEQSNITLDVHPVSSERFAQLLSSAEKVLISEGVSYLALPWKENVKHLLFHGQKHLWHRLCWVKDLSVVLSAGSESDIRELHELSRDEKWEDTFLVGVSLCHLFCSLKIEQSLADLILDNYTKNNPVYSYLQSQIFSPDRSFKQAFFNLIHRQYYQRGLLRKCKTICDRIFLPTKNDLLSLILPPRLFFLYYFYRPVRLFVQFIGVRLRLAELSH